MLPRGQCDLERSKEAVKLSTFWHRYRVVQIHTQGIRGLVGVKYQAQYRFFLFPFWLALRVYNEFETIEDARAYARNCVVFGATQL